MLLVANMKKAELSMQVLVIAILSLIVLIVLISIFRSQIGDIFNAFSRLIQSNTGAVETP